MSNHVNFLAPKCPKWEGLYLSTGRLAKLHSISEGRGRSRSPPRRSRRDDSRDRHKLDLQLVKYGALSLQLNRLLVFCANSEFPKVCDIRYHLFVVLEIPIQAHHSC